MGTTKRRKESTGARKSFTQEEWRTFCDRRASLTTQEEIDEWWATFWAAKLDPAISRFTQGELDNLWHTLWAAELERRADARARELLDALARTCRDIKQFVGELEAQGPDREGAGEVCGVSELTEIAKILEERFSITQDPPPWRRTHRIGPPPREIIARWAYHYLPLPMLRPMCLAELSREMRRRARSLPSGTWQLECGDSRDEAAAMKRALVRYRESLPPYMRRTD